MSDLIDPEDLEEALRGLLDEIPGEPVSSEWIQEQLKAIRARLEEAGESLPVSGGQEGGSRPAEVPGHVPKDTSELALDASAGGEEDREKRRHALRIALEEQEGKGGGSKLLGQIVATKIDHSKVAVRVLEASPELKRLATREPSTEVPDEEAPPPEVPEPGPEFQLADGDAALGTGGETGDPVAGSSPVVPGAVGAGVEAPPPARERDPGAGAGPEDLATNDMPAGVSIGEPPPGIPGPGPGGSLDVDAVSHGTDAAGAGDDPELDGLSWEPDQEPEDVEAELSLGLAVPPGEEPGVDSSTEPGEPPGLVPPGLPRELPVVTGGPQERNMGGGDGEQPPVPALSLDTSGMGMAVEDSPAEAGAALPDEPDTASAAESAPPGALSGLELGSMDSLTSGSVDSSLRGRTGDTTRTSEGHAVEVRAPGRASGPARRLGEEVDLADISLQGTGDLGPTPVLDLPLIHPHRYQTRVRIGAGSQGVVAEVRDRYLARQVALKVLRKELAGNAQAVYRFWREAQITGQLSHSGIVPIFDIGVLSDKSPYYTMRRVRGLTLRTILRRLRRIAAGEPEPAGGAGEVGIEPETYAWERGPESDGEGQPPSGTGGEGPVSDTEEQQAADPGKRDAPDSLPFEKVYTRRRLLEILVSAAHTLGYAHDRGVIHRDVKPGNLMVGPYGEVLVLDWGIARVLGKAAPHLDEGPVMLDMDDPEQSRQGIIKGTPAYMSPEQARGEVAAQGPWTDVYALGLVLFEILVGKPARAGAGGEAAMKMAREGVIPSLTDPDPAGLDSEPIPSELMDICVKCLEVDPQRRYPTAETFARALEAYTTGERRREAAERRALDAEHKVSMLAEIDDDISLLEEEVELLKKTVQPWADISKKRRLWAKEDRLRATRQRRDDTLAQAHELFTQALGDDPDNRRARRGLCKLYYEQLLEAERWGRTRESRRLEAELQRLDDGLLATALRGFGALELTSDPDAAGVWSFDLRPRDRQLLPAEGRYLGTTPLSTHMPMGRYLLELRWKKDDGEQVVKYPLRIRRQEKWNGHVRVPRRIPDGFVFVPGSHFVFGGDREAPGSGPRQEVWVDDFLIAVHPVTCQEYLEFLQDMVHRNPNEAAKRVPRNPGPKGGEPLWPRAPDAGYRIPGVDPHGGRWSPRLPVRCVSREDAVMYCLWRSSRLKQRARLPTETEWEKAGRGVDGRAFPWGDEFDPSFCNMKDSQPGAPELAPIGSFPVDCSPYGVMDMAGGVIEWCAGPFNRDGILAIQKGGFWLASEPNCRLARRFGVFPTEPEKFCGFRVVLSLEE